ncbi:hypothetical protein ONZ43_g4639 [Nemania bipapillata]|uniref:Uncharacterized protein n=1 Tax=Nemania bipapillata TaxID=110536 RepID=A0ACC2IK46_9PEZI|nr:hypothetical protein ONZ43_g4639 [Nemania bipapillata]
MDSEQKHKVREWTRFELDMVLALVCQHEHRGVYWEKPKEPSRRRRGKGSQGQGGHATSVYTEDRALRFARVLNNALGGIRRFERDIPARDVRELMGFMESEHKTVLEYIERQPAPFRVTRSKKHAFQRVCNNFNIAFPRWVIARRERLRGASMRANVEISRNNRIDHENMLEAEVRADRRAQLTSRNTAPSPPTPPARYEHMARDDMPEAHYGYYVRHDSSPPASWIYPPASPAFSGHDNLRQSIHPMGPKADTPMTVASPTYQYSSELPKGVHDIGQRSGSPGYFNPSVNNTNAYTPFYEDYHYPEPPQKGSKFDYIGVPETPASPASPMYLPSMASFETEAQERTSEVIKEANGTLYTSSELQSQDF